MTMEKVLKTREQVIRMSGKEICHLMETNKRAIIVRGEYNRCECSPSGLPCEHYPNGFTDIEMIIEI